MTQSTRSRPPHILVVEDNPGDILLIKESFRDVRKPVTISVVKDGQEALDFLHKSGRHVRVERPDLVMLDLNLPKISGHEVLGHIKQNPDFRKIPVLVLSTSRNPHDIQKSYDLAANCYLCKPQTLEEFFHQMKIVQEFWLEMVRLANGSGVPPAALA